MNRFVIIAFMAALSAGNALAAPTKAKYYVAVQSVKEAAGTKACRLAEKAKQLFTSTLEAQPTVTTRFPAGKAPQGKGLAAALARHKLAGYGAVLRLTQCKHGLHPPRPGKAYKILMVELGVAIDAEKIPSGQLARAGTGSAQVGIEVARIKSKELQSLREEALAASIKQAVERFVATLGAKSSTKRKRSRRSKKRRR